MSDLNTQIEALEAGALRAIDWTDPYKPHELIAETIHGVNVGVRFEVKSLGNDHLRAMYWVGASYYLGTRAVKKSALIVALGAKGKGLAVQGPGRPTGATYVVGEDPTAPKRSKVAVKDKVATRRAIEDLPKRPSFDDPAGQ